VCVVKARECVYACVCKCVCECVIGLRRECVVKAREYVCVLVLCRLDESVEWMPV